MIILKAMARIAIFIIVAEALLLYDADPLRRFAIKYSRFKMRRLLLKNTFFLTLVLWVSCKNTNQTEHLNLSDARQGTKGAETTIQPTKSTVAEVIVGANRTDFYLPMLQGKKVGVVTNLGGLIFKSSPHSKEESTHLIDSLIAHKVAISKVFAPEHGFRGLADAGEEVEDGKDRKTGLPIISLYGKNKKPSQDQLAGIDLLLFDIQDVGVRFYTYIATLQYVMEAAAEAHIPVLVLDRPNPNAHYVDGPAMEPEHSSFLGLQPIPIVYGMTIGEYALMINKESWLADGVHCDLMVIPLLNWTHQSIYSLPVRPSPNLPNDRAINLYPSLGLFEGTTMNAGRGTEMQFQIFGSPHLPKDKYSFSYTPQPNFGAKYPKEKGKLCYGLDLRETPRMSSVDLSRIIQAYQDHTDQSNFFKTAGFTKHAGTAKLQQQIEAGLSFAEIQTSWQKDIERFKEIRGKYLLYP